MIHAEKWYLDCVGDQGQAAILYWASARYGKLSANFGAVLLRSSSEPSVERSSFRPGPAPIQTESGVRWNCRRLDSEGQWEASMPPVSLQLLDTPKAKVEWNCCLPSSSATVQIGSTKFTGLGYVEHLSLSADGWEPPFTELHWGRFLAQTDSVVWIHWRGLAERTWVFHNSREDPEATIEPGIVRLPASGSVLSIAQGHVLKAGPLVNPLLRTTLQPFGVLSDLAAGRESKYLSPATLKGPDSLIEGSVIHEIVEWQR
jgi:hypothetical protein